MALVTRPNVELARTGRWKTSTGEWTCTKGQLADAVKAAKSGRFRAPVIKRGHVDPRFDGEPALGTVRNLRTSEDGEALLGDLLIPDWLDAEMPAIYPSRSVEANLGVETSDGDRYAMVTTGLALLGVTPPAIGSLAELEHEIAASAPDTEPEFASAMAVTVEFEASVAASSVFDEAEHPRAPKGSSSGGKFVSVSKGSGYKSDGENGKAERSSVEQAQAELIRLGLLSTTSGKNGGKDGLFGPKTDAAVRAYQKAHGLTVDGKVDAKLLAALKAAHASNIPAKHKTATKKAKVKAAVQRVAAEYSLTPREVLASQAAFADAQDRVWVSGWSEDDAGEITVGVPVAASVSYTPLADSPTGMAAHAMSGPVLSASGLGSLEPRGATSVEITRLREALGLDETADEAAALAKLAELKSKAEATQPPQEEAPVTPSASSAAPIVQSDTTDRPVSQDATVTPANIEELVAAKVAASVAAALAPIAEQTKAYESQIGTLSGELAERKKAEAEAVKARVLASALEDGKIRPADREQWSKDYDEAPAVTTRILASLQPGTAVPVSASGYVGEDTSTGDGYDAFEKQFGWSTGVAS